MTPTLVVDANSIFDFNKFYIFDKYNEKNTYAKLTDFLLSKIQSGEIIIIDKVYDEIRPTRYTEKLKSKIKPYVRNTLFLFDEVQRLIEDNYREETINKKGYSKQEVELKKREYEETTADLCLIAYCSHLKTKGTKASLVTEETRTDDGKIIEKIPTICKKEKIQYQKIPYALFEIYKNELRFALNVNTN